jgi:hypothetical protein
MRLRGSNLLTPLSRPAATKRSCGRKPKVAVHNSLRSPEGAGWAIQMTTSPSYWIVGAAQGGTNHHYDEFIRGRFWKLFWADKDPAELLPAARSQVEKSMQIKQGDYIAIKKKLGGRDDRGEVVIRAIGQVEKSGRGDRKIRVKWLATDLNKLIAGTGWGRSIHGPFTLDDKTFAGCFRQ